MIKFRIDSTVFAKHVFEGAADHGNTSLHKKREAVRTGDLDPVVLFFSTCILERDQRAAEKYVSAVVHSSGHRWTL